MKCIFSGDYDGALAQLTEMVYLINERGSSLYICLLLLSKLGSLYLFDSYLDFSSLQVVIYLGLWEAIRYMVRNMITFWEILIKLTRFREEHCLKILLTKLGILLCFLAGYLDILAECDVTIVLILLLLQVVSLIFLYYVSPSSSKRRYIEKNTA